MEIDGLIGSRVGSWLLRKLVTPPEKAIPPYAEAKDPFPQSKFDSLFGSDFRWHLVGKTVLDYGCGFGQAVILMAELGASFAFGVDIREIPLGYARRLAEEKKCVGQCLFLNRTDSASLIALYGQVDVMLTLDAFEHYRNPELELEEMGKLLRSGGSLFISFGPPWWHPYGCHLTFMGAPPWVHILFKERTIMSVRSLYRSDGAKRFEDVEGGQNRMTVRRFERMLKSSSFQVKRLTYVPIRGCASLSGNRYGREFFTSAVRAQLVKL